MTVRGRPVRVIRLAGQGAVTNAKYLFSVGPALWPGRVWHLVAAPRRWAPWTSGRSERPSTAAGVARGAGAAASGFARKLHRTALRRLLPHGTLFLTRHMGPAKAVPLQTQLLVQTQ